MLPLQGNYLLLLLLLVLKIFMLGEQHRAHLLITSTGDSSLKGPE
jgi:hypothetical protein